MTVHPQRGITSASAAHERAAHPRIQAGRPRRGHVLACLQVRGAPGRDRAQAGEGDGRAPRAVAVARLRARTSTRSGSRPRTASSSRATRTSSSASCPATCSSTPAASGSRCVTRPQIEFRTDERLRLGEFGIQARLVRPPGAPREPPSQGDHGHTMVYTVSDAAGRAAARARSAARQRAPARRRAGTELLGSGGAVLGRSREADVVVDDPNVSRRHAEVRPSGGSWIVRDLGSTNGVKVNGRRIQGPQSLKPRRRDRARHRPRHVRAGVARWPSTRSPWRSSSASSPCCTCSCCGWRARR